MVTPERYPLTATLKINAAVTQNGGGHIVDGTPTEVSLKVRRAANSAGKKVGISGSYYEFSDLAYCAVFDEASTFTQGFLNLLGEDREILRLVVYTNHVKMWLK